MKTTLRDFIAGREAEIKEQMKALRTELAELKLAKSALDQTGSGQPQPVAQPTGPTIKDMVREILKSDVLGLTSTQILREISERFGRDLERTSLSPQLSRMKQDGEVELIGETWSMPLPFGKQPEIAPEEDDNFFVPDEEDPFSRS